MSIFNLVEFTERWAKDYEQMLALSKTLRSLGSLEQATEERRAAHAAAVRDHEAKMAEIAIANDELDALRSRQAAELMSHAAAMDSITAEANARAVRIVSEAEETAAGLAEGVNVEVSRARDAHEETMASLSAQVAALRSELDVKRGEIERAAAEHADLSKKIEAIRATARGVLT